MARRPESLSQPHGTSNGVRHQCDPPTSTLAAQIVDRISITSRQPYSGGESFEQLLLEILGSDENSLHGNSTIETNVHVNCRLIYVVTRAGLEVLLTEDPFSNWGNLLSQASSSLAVIGLTIQRTPDALYLEYPDDNAKGIPLFLWLLPRIIALVGVQKVGILQERLAETLSTIMSAKSTTATAWPRSGPMPQYRQECVEGS